MGNDINLGSDAGARQLLHELDQEVQTSTAALSDTPLPTGEVADQQVIDAANAARVEMMRNRAQKQRSRGIEGLARRHSGIASVMRNVTINERVVGSTFQRYFSGIESGIYIIGRLGGFVVGESASEKLLESIASKIKDMDTEADEALAQMKIVMEAHVGKPNWLTPSYADAAAKHGVQLRSPLANKLLNVFEKYDTHLVQLNQLVWNGESEADETETREYEIKKRVRALAEFIRRSLVGIQNKTQPKAAPAAAIATDPVPAPAATVDVTDQAERLAA